MKTTAVALTLALALGASLPAHAQTATPPALKPLPAESTWLERNKPLVLGLGAIGGIVAFNFATGGAAALPFLGANATAGAATGAGTAAAGEAAALSVTSGAVAVSRIYAVSSAVVGAWAANWLIESQSAPPVAVPSAVALRVAPADLP